MITIMNLGTLSLKNIPIIHSGAATGLMELAADKIHLVACKK
jgi:hypothetical protein